MARSQGSLRRSLSASAAVILSATVRIAEAGRPFTRFTATVISLLPVCTATALHHGDTRRRHVPRRRSALRGASCVPVPHKRARQRAGCVPRQCGQRADRAGRLRVSGRSARRQCGERVLRSRRASRGHAVRQALPESAGNDDLARREQRAGAASAREMTCTLRSGLSHLGLVGGELFLGARGYLDELHLLRGDFVLGAINGGNDGGLCPHAQRLGVRAPVRSTP